MDVDYRNAFQMMTSTKQQQHGVSGLYLTLSILLNCYLAIGPGSSKRDELPPNKYAHVCNAMYPSPVLVISSNDWGDSGPPNTILGKFVDVVS